APKASGFLVAAEGAATVPLVTSHGASPDYGTANRLHAELDWVGTHDPAAHLTVPYAIEAVAAEGGGWPAIRARNHALALALRELVTERLGGGPPLAPAAAIGAMVALPITLPAGVAPLALEKQLLARGWEVPIVEHPRGPFVRISAHLYNHAAEGEALAAELVASGIRTRRIA
ncbi:MAG: aminotransferase, partial [Deltaproteobacteria bacterium]|nr:aminotransferase [Deltaproteobacteria bacterium]